MLIDANRLGDAFWIKENCLPRCDKDGNVGVGLKNANTQWQVDHVISIKNISSNDY